MVDQVLEEFDDALSIVYDKAIAGSITLQHCCWTLFIAYQHLIDESSTHNCFKAPIEVKLCLEHIASKVQRGIHRRKKANNRARMPLENLYDVLHDRLRDEQTRSADQKTKDAEMMRIARFGLVMQSCDRFWKASGHYVRAGTPQNLLKHENHFARRDEFGDWSYTAEQLDRLLKAVLHGALCLAQRDSDLLIQGQSLATYIKRHLSAVNKINVFVLAIFTNATIQSYRLYKCPELTQGRYMSERWLQYVNKKGKALHQGLRSTFNYLPGQASENAVDLEKRITDAIKHKLVIKGKCVDPYSYAPLAIAAVVVHLDFVRLPQASLLININGCVDQVLRSYEEMVQKTRTKKKKIHEKYQKLFLEALLDGRTRENASIDIAARLNKFRPSSRQNLLGIRIDFDIVSNSLASLRRALKGQQSGGPGDHNIIPNLLYCFTHEPDRSQAKAKSFQCVRYEHERTSELQALLDAFTERFKHHFDGEFPIMRLNFFDFFLVCVKHSKVFCQEVNKIR